MAHIVETAYDKTLSLAEPCHELKTGSRNPIKKGGPFAPFDPTELTFGKLKSPDWTQLLKPENKIELAAVMSNYVQKAIFQDPNDG